MRNGLNFLLFFALSLPQYMRAQAFITLDKVVNEWCLESPTAEKIRLAHENTLLDSKIIRKAFCLQSLLP